MHPLFCSRKCAKGFTCAGGRRTMAHAQILERNHKLAEMVRKIFTINVRGIYGRE